MSGLRRKNAAAAPTKDGTAGLPLVLPEMQTEEHHQCAEFQDRDHKSAGRKDAVLTAISVVMYCIFFRRKIMKKSLVQKLGLLGIVSFLSYTAAVVFAPLAYPGYHRMAQAVSDLSAANAPSLALWNQLSALYNVCEVVCVTVVCLGIQGKKTKLLRIGIYLFAVMEWISAVGYRMFPLSDSGYAGAFQDVMHMVVTALAVLLSIVSLTVIIAVGTVILSKRNLSMIESRCGLRCSDCSFREAMGCNGCVNMEKPFRADSCPVKSCCEKKGLQHCGECDDFVCPLLHTFAYDMEQSDNGARIEQCKKRCKGNDIGGITDELYSDYKRKY